MQRDCKNVDFCGALRGPFDMELASGGRSEPVATRTHLGRQGTGIAEDLAIGDHIIVELEDSCHDSFMIGVVHRIVYDHVGRDSVSWMGTAKSGDRLVGVRKLEPTKSGSSIFVQSSKTFPVFVEDIRMKVDMQSTVARSTRSADNAVRYTLSAGDFKLASEMCCRSEGDKYIGRRTTT